MESTTVDETLGPCRETEGLSDAKPFLHLEYGVIGRTVSTKFEPNTSSKFHFWVADRD